MLLLHGRQQRSMYGKKRPFTRWREATAMCASQCRGVLRKEGMAQNFPGKCSKMSRSSSQTPATRAFPPCMAHDALSRCCGSRAQCRHLHRHVASSMAECLCSSMPPARLVAWCVAHSQTEPWRCVSAPACLVGECCAVSQSLSHQLPPHRVAPWPPAVFFSSFLREG